MWLDILCISLLGYAFITGYQKGIIKTFSIWISGGIAFLVTMIISPYLFAFLDHSFARYNNSIDLICLISCFVILLFLIYRGCKNTLGNEEGKNTFANKVSGGLLFSTLMIASVVVLITFMENAKLLNQTTKDSSQAYHYLKPLQDKTFILFSEIKEGAASVKSRSGETSP